MEEKRTKLQVGSLLATGALFVIFLGVYLFQFTRPGPSSPGSSSPPNRRGTLSSTRGSSTACPAC